eukprot:223760_1
MSIRQTFRCLSLNQKALLFDRCCSEIQRLIQTSILGLFYRSNRFQSIAHARGIMDNRNVSDGNELDVQNGSDKEANVVFDCHSVSSWTENNKFMMATKGFLPNSGIHEWSIKILKTNRMRQEFGVVNVCDKGIQMNEFGICDTPSLGARSVYGYNNMKPTFYYASYNKNNTVRLNKDLDDLKVHKENKTWDTGDVITVRLNMNKYSIKYFLNGQQVRKTISIQKNATYYPIILYSGHCKYQVVS